MQNKPAGEKKAEAKQYNKFTILDFIIGFNSMTASIEYFNKQKNAFAVYTLTDYLFKQECLTK